MSEEITKKTEWPCSKPLENGEPCPRVFHSHQALFVHLARSKAHGGGWSTLKKNKKRIFPSESKEYKTKHYLRTKARYHSMGLNARGQPYRNRPTPIQPIVYRAKEVLDTMAAEKPQQSRIRFCPCCGENIERLINEA